MMAFFLGKGEGIMITYLEEGGGGKYDIIFVINYFYLILVLYIFTTAYIVYTAALTSGAGTTYPLGVPEFIPSF
jgi:hypothetical protein